MDSIHLNLSFLFNFNWEKNKKYIVFRLELDRDIAWRYKAELWTVRGRIIFHYIQTGPLIQNNYGSSSSFVFASVAQTGPTSSYNQLFIYTVRQSRVPYVRISTVVCYFSQRPRVMAPFAKYIYKHLNTFMIFFIVQARQHI